MVGGGGEIYGKFRFETRKVASVGAPPYVRFR